MTSEIHGAPLGVRSMAHDSSSQPKIPRRRLGRFVLRIHARQPDRHREPSRPGAAEGALGRASVVARLPTCTVMALPACCTGARKVNVAGAATDMGSTAEKICKNEDRGNGQRAQSRNRAEQVPWSEAMNSFAPPPSARGARPAKENPAATSQREPRMRRSVELWSVRAICAKPETSGRPPTGVSVPPRNCNRWPSSGCSFHSASITGAATFGRGDGQVLRIRGARGQFQIQRPAPCSGSACCGSGMRLAAPSVTGTTGLPLTVADHNSVPRAG